MSVGEFVAGVDRLLTRAHDLFPAAGGGEVAASGGGGGSVPPAPGGGGGLAGGVAAAGGAYERSQAGAAGLEAELAASAAESGAVAQQGRAGAGVIRDQARTTAAALAPIGNSAAGARLIVAAMDQHLAAMQQQLDTTSTHNQLLQQRLQQVAAGYRGLAAGDAKDSPPAVPLDSHQWKPGDPRHVPYDAGKGGKGPPNTFGSPPWVDIYDRTKDPDQVPHSFVRSDEIPGYKTLAPGELGPPAVADAHGNPDPYVELAPNTGVWVPRSDLPGAKFYPPGVTPDPLPPYGWEEWLPGSGIYLWHGDLVPEPYNAYGPSGLPAQTYPQGGH